MSQEVKGFLIASIILVVLALFVPCLESVVKALGRTGKATETAKDSFIA